MCPPPPFETLKKKKEEVSDSAHLYPGYYLRDSRRTWRSEKKKCRVPPRLSAFLDLREFRGWRRSEKKTVCCAPPPPPPFSQIPGSALNDA